jgi:hypothetical protein
MKCADSDATDGHAHPREIIPKYRFSGPHCANTKGRFESTYQTDIQVKANCRANQHAQWTRWHKDPAEKLLTNQ